MASQGPVIVIPARYGSTRFPGKPLAKIHERSLLERTWRIAKAVKGAAEVYIATDDERIARHARSFGAEALITRPECRNGTERTWDAVRQLKTRAEIIVNLQGDAALTPPWVIEPVVEAMIQDPTVSWATPAAALNWSQYEQLLEAKKNGKASGTFVVFESRFNALYFSKSPIPFVRNKTIKTPPIYRHVGLYAYRRAALEKYSMLTPSPLEEMESLEQLRALHYGIAIRVVPVDYRGRTPWSIDNPEDVAVAEEIIEREGELV
ncbi:MAG: 3-deoxy-manno-octulosonate cytidylyltransferase [Elusimicrobiota bacterium]